MFHKNIKYDNWIINCWLLDKYNIPHEAINHEPIHKYTRENIDKELNERKNVLALQEK